MAKIDVVIVMSSIISIDIDESVDVKSVMSNPNNSKKLIEAWVNSGFNLPGDGPNFYIASATIDGKQSDNESVAYVGNDGILHTTVDSDTTIDNPLVFH